MALDDTHNMEATSPQHGSGQQDDAASVIAAFEEAATNAVAKAEAFVRENPMTALAGVAAAGAIIAMAVAKKSQPAALDRRLANELNRHTEEISRAIRRNANALSNSDTAQAIETFLSRMASKVGDTVSKLPENVSNAAAELRK
jgi:ElaB/YqjD/DUF883 family membrane-anchored ribosome-binding protein